MKLTPRSSATGMMITTWMIALTPEDMDLPITVAYREAGATRSFFKIPVSRSHTSVKPYKTATNRTDCSMTPGVM